MQSIIGRNKFSREFTNDNDNGNGNDDDDDNDDDNPETVNFKPET